MIAIENYDFEKGNELYNEIIRVLTDFETLDGDDELRPNEADMYETLCSAQKFLADNFEWIDR